MKKFLIVLIAVLELSLFTSCTMAVGSDSATSSSLVGTGAIEGIKVVVGSN